MGKSIRSKSKRRNRAVKRDKLSNDLDAKIAERAEKLKLSIAKQDEEKRIEDEAKAAALAANPDAAMEDNEVDMEADAELANRYPILNPQYFLLSPSFLCIYMFVNFIYIL